MSQENQILAILFADVSGSTNLYETLGDESAHKLIASCISVISEVVVQHRGTIIKTIGDEVMSTFAEIDQAVYAAIGMQKAIDTMPPILPGQRVRPNIRVGLHMGSVIQQDSDIFGDAVNVAARMAALAKPRQIITTQQTIYSLPKGSGVDIRCIDRTTIKGRGGEFVIYEIVWEEETLTIVLSEDLSEKSDLHRLYISHCGKESCVDSNNPTVTMGRQAQNDFVVDDAAASRMHARIEYFRGKFILIDKSTNGTYVTSDTQKPIFVHNEEVVLKGSGFISLGRETGAERPEAIHFQCEDYQ